MSQKIIARIVSGYSGDPDTLGDKDIQPIDLSSCSTGDYLIAVPADRICLDEGCPHYGTLHECVNSTSEQFIYHVSLIEGGQWEERATHALRLPTGETYDAVNGWRKGTVQQSKSDSHDDS